MNDSDLTSARCACAERQRPVALRHPRKVWMVNNVAGHGRRPAAEQTAAYERRADDRGLFDDFA